MTKNQPAFTDSYKISHEKFEAHGTEFIYSNFTPRTGKYFPVSKEFYSGRAVLFNLQGFIKSFLIKDWNENFFSQPKEKVVAKFKRRCDTHLGKDKIDMARFEALHDLGYLPVKIKALPEGAAVNMKVPLFTIVNTHPSFSWLTNYLETVISCSLWKPCFVATLIREYRRLINQFADETVGNRNHTDFQLHNFAARGCCGIEDMTTSGAAFALSSLGTDSVAAIDYLEEYYNANAETEIIGLSVPASEHAVSSLGTSVEDEFTFFKRAITEYYPSGIVSIVADTYDYFKFIIEYAAALKDEILARPVDEIGLSKVVFRPDSGDQYKVICGENYKDYTKDCKTLDEAKLWSKENVVDDIREKTPYGERGSDEVEKIFKYGDSFYKIKIELEWNRHDKQYYYIDGSRIISCEETVLTPEQKGTIQCLWEIFGGTISEKGYKVLNERVGCILGDGCDFNIIQSILEGLKNKGFASSNMIFGVGSWSQTGSRDSLGIAIKATWAQVNGVGYNLFKDPKTDDGMKKSAKGLLRVDLIDGEYVLKDQCSREEEEGGELKTVFEDSKLLIDRSLAEVRAEIRKYD
jgi:nicotinamide phosphoribosyltransferase